MFNGGSGAVNQQFSEIFMTFLRSLIESLPNFLSVVCAAIDMVQVMSGDILLLGEFIATGREVWYCIIIGE